MKRVRLDALNDFAEWRKVARGLLLGGVAPEEVVWDDPASPPDLFADPGEPIEPVGDRAVGVVPPKFIELAEAAVCHSDPQRFALLYRLLFRLQKDRTLIEVRSDPDVSRIYRFASEIRRDSHKMKAFVRFREEGGFDGGVDVSVAGEERFAAWFEPDHYVLERTAPFFVRRFASMKWAIFTPYGSAAWDGATLVFGGGARRDDAPGADAMEEVWLTYFGSIFNPARLKVGMMKSEMPVKYWRNLPEAELIPSLIRGAKEREAEMIERASTQPPARHVRAEARKVAEPEAAEMLSLADARAAIQGCRRCPLYEYATQAVFGEGPETAEVMFVGEQPGDQEDLAGKPFIGPAGQMFNRALDKVGIDRSRTYVTNSVKHFKFEPKGKRRIHAKPNSSEIQACRFWINLEREFIKPKLVVAMGATAVQSLTGKTASITSLRGRKLELEDGTNLLVTVHPSYLLRIPERDRAAAELERFEDDLLAVKVFIDKRGDDPRSGRSQGGYVA